MTPRLLLLLLSALGSIAGQLGSSFELLVEPKVLVVEYGGSIQVKLRTTCQDPEGHGSVETSILKRPMPAPPGEELVELLNVTTWNSTILCYYSCFQERKVETVQLLVYRRPQSVALEPVPALATGESHELVCRVLGAAPLWNLTVVLRQGNRTLHEETFKGWQRGREEEEEEEEEEEVRVSQRVKVSHGDDGHRLSCQALLDLAPHGPRFHVTSQPLLLSVYEFPEDPELPPHIHLETGETLNTSCSVGIAYPAARFQLRLANQTLPVTVSRDGHRATAPLSHHRPGNLSLVCTVRVGPLERRAEATVHVYRFPSPQLNVSSANVAVGTEVTGSCSLPPGHSPQLLLRIRAGHRVLGSWGPSPAPFNLTAGEEDDGLELSCDAHLPGAGKEPKRSRPVRLHVTAGPRMDDGSCPPKQSWTEGQDETLRCSARGNPPPRLECAKDGEPFPAGVPLPATRAHAGTYRCQATNLLGMAVRSITVVVQYHDLDLVLVLVPALAVAALVAGGGFLYGLYYRQKKIRRYRLRDGQKNLEMEPLHRGTPRSHPGDGGGNPPGAAPGAAGR